MTSAKDSSVVERLDVEPQQCCVAQVQALLKLVRASHRLEQTAPCVEDGIGARVETDDLVLSTHDFHVGELEASLLADCADAPAFDVTESCYDDPLELAHARLIFAITWLVPLLLVSAILAIFGATVGQALRSLLQFSLVAISLPLTGSLAALLVRGFQRRYKRRLQNLPKRVSGLD